MDENSQLEYDVDKYELYLRIQTDKILESFEERTAIIMLNYPQFTLEQAIELDQADATMLVKAAIRREHQRTLNILSAAAAAQNKDTYKKLHGILTKAIKGLK